jgi:predicted Zn finger-like uncharacterized protein
VIVTCEQCETQFQLDDSKVPESGIRVRCSRCKHAFFVESPHCPDTARADDLAREALAQDSAVASRDRDSNAAGLEDDESDWQFNEEVDRAPAPDDGKDDLAAAQEAVDDLLGSTFSGSVDPVTGSDESIDPVTDSDESIDPVTGSDESIDPVTGSDESIDPVTGSDESIDLGQLDLDDGIDLGGSDLDLDAPGPSMEDAAGAELDLSPEPAEDPNAVTNDRSIASEDSARPVTPAPAEPEGQSLEASAVPDRREASDDRLTQLGSPDDLELRTGDATPEPPSSGTPVGRLSPSVPEEIENPSRAAAPVHRGADDGAFDVDTQTVTGAAWISRVRGGVGWALVGLLCAYAGFVGLWPRASASEPVLGAQPVAGLEADAVRGRWIENAVAGSIYVVSGELRATSSAPLPTGSLLRVRLLDADGAAIGVEPAAVGPLVFAERLRHWSLRDLREFQETGALRLAWDPLAPGEHRPFHAILGRVPPTAVAFEFQVVAAASQAPEPDAGADIPHSAPDLAPRAMIE